MAAYLIPDAWGKVLSITGSMADTIGTINPLLYRGYIYDHDTGLYYLQSRYYNPNIGRFISADKYIATGQGLTGNNMFAYCGNQPIVYNDPTGNRYELNERDKIGLVVATAVAICLPIVNNVAHKVAEDMSIFLDKAIYEVKKLSRLLVDEAKNVGTILSPACIMWFHKSVVVKLRLKQEKF